MRVQPAFIALTLIASLFLAGSLLWAATKEDVLRAIAEERAQVQLALQTGELRCDTQYWAHNMITVRYDNGSWVYKCGNPCLVDGVLADNVYYCGG